MNRHFTTTILEWFEENRRDLPWRETSDPYAIWLSEIILQQTRIQQGMAYWQRFMERWPTVEQLAAATEDEVLRLWQGLGYYSRARNLHAAAQQIVAMGGFPTTFEGIRSLKGVGDYTAAAIASIAFGLPVAVVDGNVYRVLARHFGIDTPINTTEGKKLFAALAQEMLPPDRPSDYNQAMMDFGAIQCTPQSPRCLLCPLAERCVALRTGRVDELPVKVRKLKLSTRRFYYIYIRCNGHTLLHRRTAGDIWQGLWEPPLFEQEMPAGMPCVALRKQVRHVLTHRIIVADFYLLDIDNRDMLPAAVQQLLKEKDYLWVPESDIDRYGVPRLVEMLFEVVNA